MTRTVTATTMRPAMALAPGTRVGSYQILSAIGGGGMGEVYRARDSRLERDVAIKVLSDHLATNADATVRFEREAKAIASLSHPNILAIHDFGQEEGFAYSVTELLEGETLRSLIARSPIPWRRAAELGAAIADGLGAAHAKGIIHRDLKPENIFITEDGRVKILDFGIAQLQKETATGDDEDQSAALTEQMKTDPGAVMGTAGYMSPEQLRGEKVHAASDLFSLGCLLYEMLSGKRAFAKNSVVETLSAILTETPPPIDPLAVPLELARVVDRCLEKNAAQRFHSASDLGFALRAIGTSTGLRFEPPGAAKRRRVRGIFIGTLLLVMVAATALVFTRTREESRKIVSVQPAIESLAILPFRNGTGDASAEYLVDGVTETLINNVSQIPGLRVMSRTSVFHYKNVAPDPARIGRELKVAAVLVGEVRRMGDLLLISAELVSTADSSHIWGKRYQRPASDLLLVQDAISDQITQSLRLRITADSSPTLTQRHSENAAAYDSYLKGRYEWNRRSAAGLYAAIEYFNQAIAADPNYALAYAGLADCYNLLDIWAGLPTRETFPKAKDAATKALLLDDQLAEAHTSLAYALHSYEWNWAAAEREYKRALELNPNYATAHQWYSEYLTAMGRFEEAERAGSRALELDPMSPIINAVVGWNLLMARRYGDSVAQNQKTTRLFPTFMPGHAYLGLANLESSRTPAAIEAFQQSQKLADITVVLTWLARAQLQAGQLDAAKATIATIEQRGRSTYLPPFYMASLAVAQGDRDKAFRLLDKAITDRTGAVIWLKVDPSLDPIRTDPRFAKLLARVGF